MEAEALEEAEMLTDDFGIVSIIHLVRCAVDVARQHKEIRSTNILIHPLSTIGPSNKQEGHELLLTHISDTLHTVIKELDVMLKINTRGGTVSDREHPKSEAKM